MTTLIVELYAGPGAGKSTLAAQLFGALKDQDVPCELVTEWVKERAWDGARLHAIDQLIVYARQLERERRFYGRDMIVVTDSPLALSEVYAAMAGDTARAAAITRAIASDQELAARAFNVQRFRVQVAREKTFHAAGRFHDEEQARHLDDVIAERFRGSLHPYKRSVGVAALAKQVLRAWGRET